tara:strand:- start:40 stop:459 length:420 start_codon:yes stop_codon:yes gene_type:complete
MLKYFSTMSTTPTSPKTVLIHFDWSLARFKEALEKEDTEYYRGAALQRFSLTYDLAIKTIRAFAEEQNTICLDDASCFEWAVNYRWLKNDSGWKKIAKDYANTLGQPTDATTDQVFAELPKHYHLMSHLRKQMKAIPHR